MSTLALMAAATLASCEFSTTPPEMEETVDAYVAAYNRHDVDAMAALLDSEAKIIADGLSRDTSPALERYRTVVFPQHPDAAIRIGDRIQTFGLVGQTEMHSGFGVDAPGLVVYHVGGGCIFQINMSSSQ